MWSMEADGGEGRSGGGMACAGSVGMNERVDGKEEGAEEEGEGEHAAGGRSGSEGGIKGAGAIKAFKRAALLDAAPKAFWKTSSIHRSKVPS